MLHPVQDAKGEHRRIELLPKEASHRTWSFWDHGPLKYKEGKAKVHDSFWIQISQDQFTLKYDASYLW